MNGDIALAGALVVFFYVLWTRAWREASEADRREAALRAAEEQLDREWRGPHHVRPAPPPR